MSKHRNMKALVLNEEKRLQWKEVDTPSANEGEALVQIKSASLNHRELWITKGLYPGMALPCILGADGTGVVAEVGSSQDENWIGKEVIIYPAYAWGDKEEAPSRQFRVLGMPDPGTMAEYISVPISSLVNKPAYLTWKEAAAIPVAGLTAWRALVRHGSIDADSSVLITGIGGGVAQAGLSIAKAFGAKIYVTSSSDSKIELAKASGAEGGVNYKSEDWNLQLKEISGGIDIVLDSSPAPKLDDYFKFMNYGGRIVAYGSTGNRKTEINISKMFLRHIQFIGTAMGSPKEFQDMLSFMEKNEIRPVVHSSYAFAKAEEAFKALGEGKQVGKICLED